MFCRCGTLVHLPTLASEETICSRCSAVITEPLHAVMTTSREFSEKTEHVQPRVQGARIRIKCPECGRDELTYNTAYLRSADEGQTVFYTCECGFKETASS